MKAIQSFGYLCLIGVMLLLINSFQTAYYFNSMEKNKSYYTITYTCHKTMDKMLSEWEQYSKDTNVNIGIVTYADINRISIYQTLFDKELNKILTKGSLPKEQEAFLSNTREASQEKKTGHINIPEDEMKISFYFIGSIYEVKDSNNIFIQASGDLREKTELFLRQYGELELDDEYNLDLGNSIQTYVMIIVFVITAILLLFCTFLGIELQKKKMMVLIMTGLERHEMYFQMLKKQTLIDLAAVTVFLPVLYFVLSFFSVSVYLMVLFETAIGALLIKVLLMGFQILLMKRSLERRNPLQTLQEKTLLQKLTKVNYAVVFLSTVVLLLFLNSFGQQYLDLKKEEAAAETWKRTQNIYRVAVGDNIEPGDEKGLREENRKLVELYNALAENENVFLMDAGNFSLTGKNPYRFSFEDNIKEEKNVFGMGGNSVLINKNYLKVNPIEADFEIESKLIEDENVLNVLVPDKLKEEEKRITEELQDNFYTYKVEMENETRRHFNEPLLKTKKEDLKINLIFVKSDQKYFTFHSFHGIPDNGYCIIDPLAVVLNPSMDQEFIGAEMTTSLYVRGNSHEDAMKSIDPALKETETTRVISYMESVFEENGYRTNRILSLLKMYTAVICMLLTDVLLLLFYQVYWYFRVNHKKISIQILNGIGNREINRRFFIINGAGAAVAAVGLSLLIQSLGLLLMGGVISCFYLVLICFYGSLLSRKELSRLKGRD